MIGKVGRDQQTEVGRGYRQTAQRAMILAEVQAAEGHLTAGEIFERVRRKDQHGLIQELTFADQASRYDGRVERHDHVHCTSCGLLVDVDVPVALMARHVAEERTGFAITSHHTVFAGTCPACQRAEGQENRWTEKSRDRASSSPGEGFGG
jgi:Fur family peroxide stress response transcriptional regulator